MDDVQNTLCNISKSLGDLVARISAIETNISIAQDLPASQQTTPAEAVTEDINVDVTTAFLAIKTAVAGVKLPSSLIVPTDKTGIKRNDQPVLNLLTKCSKYVETCLKVIQSPSTDASTKIQELLTVLTAHVILLQEEHAAVVVQGSFDEGVARFFRSLQRTNSFTPEALDNLRAAASIASVYRPQRSAGRRGFQGQRFGYRGRGRGSSGRGGYQQQQYNPPDDTS